MFGKKNKDEELEFFLLSAVEAMHETSMHFAGEKQKSEKNLAYNHGLIAKHIAKEVKKILGVK